MSRQTSRGDASVGQVRRAFNVSRQAWWAAKARNSAPPPGPRGPRRRLEGAQWAPDDVVRDEVVRLAEEHKGWGVPKVWSHLRFIKNVVVGRRRVYALMKELGLLLPAAHREPRDAGRGHVAVPDSNRRWATDLTTAWTVDDGVVAICPVIDCGDRTILDIDVSKSQQAPATLLPVERALFTAFGSATRVPPGLELLTDHGPQYTGHDCDVLCQRWNIEHRFSGVGRPTGNALAERIILTLKTELVWTRDWRSAAELREALRAWMNVYNRERPHEALRWKTPAQKRAENLTRIMVAA